MLVPLLVLLGLYLGACFALSGRYLSPKRRLTTVPAGMALGTWGGQECFVTPRLARGERVPVVFVLAHGLGGGRDSFAGVAQTLDRAGYGAILPPMPGQDANPAPRIGFGVEEADLLVKIAEEARGLPGAPKVVVGGVSMGGAAAWLASEKAPWVSGVVTESAYTDMATATDLYLGRLFPGSVVALRPVVWFGTLRSGIAIGSIRPIEAAGRWKGPSVVMHAGADGLFPVSMGDRFAAAAGTRDEVFPGAAHAFCRESDPGRYDALFLGLARKVGRSAPQ